MNNYSTRFLAKNLLKQFIWSSFTHHRSSTKKPICLYAGRRGGSTMLMQAIASSKGIRYLDQPFSVHTNPVRFHEIVAPIRGEQITQVEIKSMFQDYLAGLISGKYIVSAPWKIGSRNFHFTTNRVVLKIINAKNLMEEIAEVIDPITILLTRHPIPTALSKMGNGWQPEILPFMNDRSYSEKYLGPTLADFCWNIIKQGSLFERHLLDWCLEFNKPLQQLANHNDWLFISYEESVQNRRKTAQFLAKHLNLGDENRILKSLISPSISTKTMSEKHVAKAIHDSTNISLVLNRWMDQVSSEEKTACDNILSAFNIDLYSASSAIPAQKYLQF